MPRLIRGNHLYAYKIPSDNKSYSEIIVQPSTAGLWKFAARHSVVLTTTRYNETRTMMSSDKLSRSVIYVIRVAKTSHLHLEETCLRPTVLI